MGERIIRPGIRSSERIAKVIREGGWLGEIFFVRLLTTIDDFGRMDARPAILRAELFPLQMEQVSEADIQSCLKACVSAELITLYSVADKPFLEVHNFRQRLRSSKSRWPAPPSIDECPSSAGQRPDNVPPLSADGGDRQASAGQCHDSVPPLPADGGRSPTTAGQCQDIVTTLPTETETESETEQNVAVKTAASPPEESTRKPWAKAKLVPPIREVTDYFISRWWDKYGKDYPFKPVDGVKANELLEACGGSVAGAKAAIERYLSDSGDFYCGHSLKLLVSQIHRFLVRGQTNPAADPLSAPPLAPSPAIFKLLKEGKA